ncbi:hypothetical protein A1Q2_04939 [Trichosporon asahii var. asahii CBS 8904]|uniref:Uncharacterized protein n=1 Tax=Trichosporon asahii var. asahii (strain CBS 8904) TaxID=1220162 RepID=K1VMX6_TRIAC|nr:hypothetical protein A1Q2_04939 [Trichosporon asahii var. asahii CBS 8904]
MGGSNNNNKGKAPKVHAGESFADAVREGTPADPNGDQNARLKPGETYADAVQEGLPENHSSSSDAPPAYSANGAKASDSKTPSSTAQAQSQGGSSSQNSKNHALHLPNAHHSHRLGSPSPSPSPGGHRHGHHSHPHSHHFSTGGGGGGSGGIFAAQFGPGGAEEGVVMVPEREYIYALMRARRRFWATLFWALLIYLVAGAIVGGGVADANSHKGKHKDKNGKWHDHAAAVTEEKGEPLAFVRVGVPADRSQEVDMPWDYRVQDVTAPE